ncbi:MAG TPA: LLM class F420-dependent oxidoreductase [Acidimicrobiales bacterium]
MRIGIFASAQDLDGLVDGARGAADDGFAGYWVPQIFGFDAMAVAGVIGREVPGIEIGTSVVPTFPRHPMVMAQQALTANALAGGRFTLGIGLSHQIVVESMWGYSYGKPLRHMREYLSALIPLVRGESASVSGQDLTCHGALSISGVPTPPVLVAALGPRMLELAGTVADGTITWMTGPKTLASHIVPSITAAAAAAGRPAPRIGAGLPVCVTDDIEATRARANELFAIYRDLPSYRAMLDREGVDGPADVAIVGREDDVEHGIQACSDAGVTDFAAVEFGADPDETARTRALLKSLL